MGKGMDMEVGVGGVCLSVECVELVIVLSNPAIIVYFN